MRTDFPGRTVTLSRAARLLAVVTLPFAFTGCAWFTDFKEQPSIDPWQSPSQNPADSLVPPRFNPQNSVSINGTAAAGFAVSYTPAPQTIDSLGTIPNPTPITEASLANGQKYYNIYCAMCHGVLGNANGTLRQYNPAYAWSPSIIEASTQARTDGYIWGMMRNGRGSMPAYPHIEEMDRWDVVNYVRALQGSSPIPHGIGPAGYPGQNGTTVPGYTRMAPSKSAPFAPADIQLTPGSSGANSATTGRARGGPNGGYGAGSAQENHE